MEEEKKFLLNCLVDSSFDCSNIGNRDVHVVPQVNLPEILFLNYILNVRELRKCKLNEFSLPYQSMPFVSVGRVAG